MEENKDDCIEKENFIIQRTKCTGSLHYTCTKLPSYQTQLLVNVNYKFTCTKCVQIKDSIHEACFDYTHPIERLNNGLSTHSEEIKKLTTKLEPSRKKCESIKDTHERKTVELQTQVRTQTDRLNEYKAKNKNSDNEDL